MIRTAFFVVTVTISGLLAYPPTYQLHPEVDTIGHITVSILLGMVLLSENTLKKSSIIFVTISVIWELVEYFQLFHLKFYRSAFDTGVDLIANIVGFTLCIFILYLLVYTGHMECISRFAAGGCDD